VKIGLASDSFGNIEALVVAFDALSEAGAERVFFLGGRYADVDAALARKCAWAPAASQAPADGNLGFLDAVQGALSKRTSVGIEDQVEKLAQRVVRVASRACPEYQRDRAPRKVFEMVDGLICCLVHDKSDLTRDDIANASVLFHGNSGHPALVAIGPRIFVTPGHLRALDPDGRPPTFALLEVGGQGMEMTVYSAFGEEIGKERVPLASRSKVSVK
jgi:predicted phosphodiesterase